MRLTTAELEAAHSALRRLRRRHLTLMVGQRLGALSEDEEIEAIVEAVLAERDKRVGDPA